jgi:hypothetical protein
MWVVIKPSTVADRHEMKGWLQARALAGIDFNRS